MTPTYEKQFSFQVVIRGKGGHGSRPANCINPVDCFAALHGALKAAADAIRPSALKFTAVDGASKPNTIRDEMSFTATFFCDTQEQADRFAARLPEIVDASCAAYRCQGSVVSPA